MPYKEISSQELSNQLSLELADVSNLCTKILADDRLGSNTKYSKLLSDLQKEAFRDAQILSLNTKLVNGNSYAQQFNEFLKKKQTEKKPFDKDTEELISQLNDRITKIKHLIVEGVQKRRSSPAEELKHAARTLKRGSGSVIFKKDEKEVKHDLPVFLKGNLKALLEDKTYPNILARWIITAFEKLEQKENPVIIQKISRAKEGSPTVQRLRNELNHTTTHEAKSQIITAIQIADATAIAELITGHYIEDLRFNLCQHRWLRKEYSQAEKPAHDGATLKEWMKNNYTSENKEKLIAFIDHEYKTFTISIDFAKKQETEKFSPLEINDLSSELVNTIIYEICLTLEDHAIFQHYGSHKLSSGGYRSILSAVATLLIETLDDYAKRNTKFYEDKETERKAKERHEALQLSAKEQNISEDMILFLAKIHSAYCHLSNSESLRILLFHKYTSARFQETPRITPRPFSQQLPESKELPIGNSPSFEIFNPDIDDISDKQTHLAAYHEQETRAREDLSSALVHAEIIASSSNTLRKTVSAPQAVLINVPKSIPAVTVNMEYPFKETLVDAIKLLDAETQDLYTDFNTLESANSQENLAINRTKSDLSPSPSYFPSSTSSKSKTFPMLEGTATNKPKTSNKEKLSSFLEKFHFGKKRTTPMG